MPVLDLQPHTTVRDVLTIHPETFGVFESHGMCDSCKTAPPPVPLHVFSVKHAVDLPTLIAELQAAMQDESPD
ncbi:MAG: hypothetical protein HND57_05680 [Planctomycetes bacterium]|nr:hypothetical protein [Planctomycetota bacterium]